jgi:flagellar hook-associated protein 2
MPEGIQLAGLSSGFDWKSFSDRIIAYERSPAARYEAEKTKNDTERGQLSQLGTLLGSLQSSVKALASPDLALGRKVSNVSPTPLLKANVGTKTPLGTYAVHVETLATASMLRGGMLPSPLEVESGDTLSIKVGDSGAVTSIPISVGMSVKAIVSAINASGAGVTAMANLAGTQIVMTSRETGANRDIIVGGTLRPKLGLPERSSSEDRGSDAAFLINGVAFKSSDNVLDSSDHGVDELSIVAQKTSSGETFLVSADTALLRGRIDSFVSSYNSVVGFVEKATAISTSGGKMVLGPLASNREVQNWIRSLRVSLFSGSGVGAVSNLSSMGLDFSDTDQLLAIKDPGKLEATIAAKSVEVISFFNASGTGLANVLAKKLEAYVGNDGSSGRLKDAMENYVKANAALDSRIQALDRYLQQRRSQLEAGFIAMESAQSKMSQIQGMLNNAFGQKK